MKQNEYYKDHLSNISSNMKARIFISKPDFSCTGIDHTTDIDITTAASL